MSICKKKGGRWCSAPNCKNNSNTNKDISFFRFPKDEQRAKKWSVYCRREDLLKKDATYLNNNCTICSVHFEGVMFLNFLRNRLKSNAVPTLFKLPNPPKQISQKRKAPKKRNSETYQVAKKAKTDVQKKLQKVKCEANENETNSIQEIHKVYIPETTVKIEKMDQEEEEEQQPQELEEYSLNEDLSTLKQEYVEENVKEEPQSEDESNYYVPDLNAEEIYVKKEEFEEDYDSEAGNKISL